MHPRPVIYVNRITNLSDARYCAGMGVDLLGFVITPAHPDYVSPVQFQEIMGWVSGPSRVVEIIDGEPFNIEEAITQYAPDLIHLTLTGDSSPPPTSFPMILETRFANWASVQNKIQNNFKRVEYVVLTEIPADTSELNALGGKYPILLPLGQNEISIKEVQQQSGVIGFVLQGSPELKPGLKDYDHLSRILESLDS